MGTLETLELWLCMASPLVCYLISPYSSEASISQALGRHEGKFISTKSKTHEQKDSRQMWSCLPGPETGYLPGFQEHLLTTTSQILAPLHLNF